MINRRRLMGAAIGAAALSLMVAPSANAQSKPAVRIGGKNFTEQLILAKITALYLKEKGYEVTETTGMSSPVIRQALETGQVDLYWEYTGTALVVFNKQPGLSAPDEAYQKVKDLDAAKGLTWLKPSAVNNTYALIMRKADADRLDIRTISDLAGYVQKNSGDLTFATTAEFYSRNDGFPVIAKAYDLNFPADKIVKMDSGLLYNALNDGKVGVAVGFATDGRIPAMNLVVLEEDKSVLPVYAATPVIRSDLAAKDPGLVELLNVLPAHLDDATMSRLNAAVDVEKQDLSDVARSWLETNGLIKK